MDEMLQKKTAKNYQSGQAMVEYILILAISVALVLGLMNQLYKPFGSWLQNYMGAYLECLIDIGELPSLGYEGGSGECNAKFQPGTFGAGRPPKPGEGSAAVSAVKNKSGSGGDSSGSGGGGSTGSSRRSSADLRGFAVGGQTGADGPSSGANSGVMTEKLSESQYFRLKSAPYTIAGGAGNQAAKGISGLITVEQQKIKRREQKAFTNAKIEEGDEGSQKAKKLLVKKSERKAASEEESTPWGFSQYLKYFLILIIVIAIILFLGGQVLQISKSMEK